MKSLFPYNKDQLIFNSNRIILNSKEDSIFLLSNDFINFSSNNGIHFNTEKEVIVNANKIQLGIDAKEPLVKGEQLKNLLTKLLNDLKVVGTQLSQAIDSNGNPITTVQTAGNSLNKSTSRIKTLLKKINSDQNFTI